MRTYRLPGAGSAGGLADGELLCSRRLLRGSGRLPVGNDSTVCVRLFERPLPTSTNGGGHDSARAFVPTAATLSTDPGATDSFAQQSSLSRSMSLLNAAALGDSEVENPQARRMLDRVLAKLEGRDGDSAVRQSVEAHVSALIADARDENNLSKMFEGWSAFV